MNPFESPEQAAVVAHLLVRLQEEIARGAVPKVEDYLRAYPGHEELVRRELHARLGGSELDASAGEGEVRRGRIVGSYRCLREIGRGGQGEVHLAEDLRLGRQVALKLLRGVSVLDTESRARFRREAQVASRLDHPGLCTIYEVGTDGGVDFLALRYVEGETLAEQNLRRARAGNEGSRTPRNRAEIEAHLVLVEKLARAVHAAHEAGVLHRDLKPRNVIVTPAGDPVILDFGLARDLRSEGSELTRSGDVFGTPHYMAPEQVRGAGGEDASTDVWALGVILYELVTGTRPFEAPTREALYRRILEGVAPDLRTRARGVGRDLAVVVATALAPIKSQRYGSAIALAEDLARCRRGEPIAARPPGRLRRLLSWVRRRPAHAAALVACAIALGTGGFLLARWPELERARLRAETERFERELEEAFLALAAEDPGAAEQRFEDLLAARPESIEARAGLAMARLQIEEDGETEMPPPDPARAPALELYLEALGNFGPGHAEDRAGLERARELLERCVLTSASARALYHYELAHVHLHLGASPEADAVRAALQFLWPNEWQARYWVARLRPFDQAAIALAELESLAAGRPEDWILHEAMGVAAYRCRRFGAAEAYFAATSALRPDLALPVVGRARSLDRLGRSAEGERTLETYLREFGEHPAVLAELAASWTRRGAAAGALELLGRAEADGLPRTRELAYSRALALGELGRSAEAEAIFRDLLDSPAGRTEAHHALATMLLGQERFEDALPHLRAAIAERPTSTEILYELGVALENTGDREGALAAWEREIELDPEDVDALAKLGWSYSERGEFARAAEMHARHLALDPQDEQAAFRCAQAWANASEHARAAEAYRGAIRAAPDWAEAWCNLGQELRRAGRFEEAVEALAEGHARGSARGDWGYPSAAWLARAEQARDLALELDAQLLRANSLEPAERCALAEVAAASGRYREAGVLFFEAFRIQPELQEQLSQAWRVLAARTALRHVEQELAAGESEDDRVLWSERARIWIEDELEARMEALEAGRATAPRTRQLLQRWLADPAFAPAWAPSGASVVVDRGAWADLHARIEESIRALGGE